MKGRSWITALALVAAALLAAYFVGRRLGTVCRTRLSLCIEDGGTGGGLALARFLERIGYKVTALDRPVWDAVEELGGTGRCLITAGDEKWSPPDPHEGEEAWQRLEKWLQRGNTLLAITTTLDGLPKLLQARPAWTTELDSLERFGWFGYVDPIRPERLREETVPVDTAWGKLVVRSSGLRLTGELDEGLKRWSDSKGAVLLEKPIGRGRLIVLLDDFAWTNAGLDCGENAAVLARLLAAAAQAAQVAVDEWRHGHGRAESFLTFALSLPGGTSFVVIAALIGLLFLGSANIRFGPAEPYEQPERRTVAELDRPFVVGARPRHIEIARARAAPLAVAGVAERMRNLAHLRGHVSPELAATLAAADDYVAGGERPVQPTAACTLVRELIRMRKLHYGQ